MEANFMQVGKPIECGHCNPLKYGEGLKNAERLIPNYKCDCQCHSTMSTPIEEWRKHISCPHCVKLVESALLSERKRIADVARGMMINDDSMGTLQDPSVAYNEGYDKALTDLIAKIEK